MTSIYFIALIIHLLSAIFFVGYFLLEIFVLKALYSKISTEQKSILGQRKVKMIFISLFLLFGSGGIMATQYLGNGMGFFANTPQSILSLKIILSLILLALVLYWYFIVKILQRPLPLKKLMHPLSLILLLLIVILSKVMFYV
ncbi:DUF3149 domain-containing protein [Helicobacter cholecystus]|uniref:DUF3149 domain-containing protein n=1 Tax=Helicobacter cholecystus TaxID=45498 RepID=A0A3D8IVL7_9HELI|nr:DUF3149 domain-containing protein [Helicobacter cholecystus]RDU69262.1 DUF3149 domain-containing protein [Helicobacter cholecystus]VEJ24340.1 translocation protein, low temperature [Helicobacter cholecystus]